MKGAYGVTPQLFAKLAALGYAAYKGKNIYGSKKPRTLRIRRDKNQTSNRNKDRGQNTSVLTNQHDVRTTKTRRRLGWKKRRQLRFQKRVKAALDHSDELVTLVETHSAVTFNSSGPFASNQQTFPAPTEGGTTDKRLGLYGEDNQGLRRYMVELRDKARSVIATGTASGPIYGDFSSLHFRVKNCKANIAFKNDHNDTVYLDIYECVARTTLNNVAYHTAQGCWEACLADSYSFLQRTGAAAFTAQKQSVNISGVTPFTCPDFGKYWKVLRKVRIQLGPGQMTNFTYVGYAGKVLAETDLALGSVPAGKCKDLIIIANPTFNSNAPDVAQPLLTYEITKKYSLAWDGQPGEDQSIAGYYIE